jgi:hypothetical protein
MGRTVNMKQRERPGNAPKTQPFKTSSKRLQGQQQGVLKSRKES